MDVGKRNWWRATFALAWCTVASTTAIAEPTRLLRYPDIHGDFVVFTYAGDLWRAPANGGGASRLTSHPGLEVFAKISPDGKWIAFTGQYGGDEQVYIMPATGGEPRQLTYYPAVGPLPPRWGYDNQVYGWTPDGSRILFRSMRDGYAAWGSRLYTVAVAGGLPKPLPTPLAGAGVFGADGKRLFYSPRFRDFRNWKRYEGGWAQDLYIFDTATGRARQMTHGIRTERDPMWFGGHLYFASDSDGVLNLYRMGEAGGTPQQLTHYQDFDVRWPSDDSGGRIVFERNGALSVLDIESGAIRDLDITVPEEGLARRPQWLWVGGNIGNYNLSPDGARAVVSARGDLFTAPFDGGVTRNLTRTPGAKDQAPAWSHDSMQIAFISDASGEEEIWLVAQDGSAPPRQLTTGHKSRFAGLRWSADDRMLVVGDKMGALWAVDVASGKLIAVDKSSTMEIYDAIWSPDGRYLAYSKAGENGFNSIYIWDRDSRRSHRVTSDDYHETEPVWDPAGNYLFFFANRSYDTLVGGAEWDFITDSQTGIFALALRRDAPSLFPPRNEEAGTAAAANDVPTPDSEGSVPAIEFDGLAERLVRLPVAAADYFNLNAARGRLIYQRYSRTAFGQPADGSQLMTFDLTERLESTLVPHVRGYTLSSDGEHILADTRNGLRRYPVSGGSPDELDVSNMKVYRVPQQEWAQIFDETWRRFRDDFYVANMHGHDWQAIGDQYRRLLEFVAHRADLNDLLSEMVGELNVSHAYITGGDLGLPERPNTGVLGARLKLDANSGLYRIDKILAGDAAEYRYRSPFSEFGVDVRAGDYLLAINGTPLTGEVNPYALLADTAGDLIELTVASALDGPNRRVLVTALGSESDLNYLAWWRGARDRVAKASNGRVGYIHLPDMGPDGLSAFVKQYYGQLRKEALIIDVRGNGGGNVSQMILERLMRPLSGYTFARDRVTPTTTPTVVFTGPLVAVIDEFAGSDGDLFAYNFRAAGLGPLVGKRTWGGVIGIGGGAYLIDGGVVYVPEFGNAGTDGSWIIEGHGVDPDIEVDNTPEAQIRGDDPQLERAIAEAMRRIKDSPTQLPKRPPPPVKTR